VARSWYNRLHGTQRAAGHARPVFLISAPLRIEPGRTGFIPHGYRNRRPAENLTPVGKKSEKSLLSPGPVSVRWGRQRGPQCPLPAAKVFWLCLNVEDGAMNETRQSLLVRAQAGETNAWNVLTDLYRPLILGWLNRQGVPAADLEDLSQEVLLSVVKHLPGFQHSGQRGAFRSWLRTIVCRRTADYWRTIDAGAHASGGSGATAALQQIADPESELNRQWDEEH